jgi:hypothetical protein
MPLLNGTITDIALVTDQVILTVKSVASVCLVYPVNLVIALMVFGVAFAVVRRVLRR